MQDLLYKAKKLLEEKGCVVVSWVDARFYALWWPEITGLPMYIKIDEMQSYKQRKHPLHIRFQTNTSKKYDIDKFASMDMNGNITVELPRFCRLKADEINMLRNFVNNNSKLLEYTADMKICLHDAEKILIKGGKKASQKQLIKLDKDIKCLLKKK